jgi:endonuclease-3
MKKRRNNHRDETASPPEAHAQSSFPIAEVLARVREAVRPYPRAALFELADEGHDSVFELLAACIISIRTRDEQTLPIARRLFARARTPAEVAALSPREVEALIAGCAFAENKGPQIHAIARRAVTEHGGALRCEREVLLDLHGVGPKCANLVLGIACGQPFIGVDIHVHRVTNRWGYVQAKTPEQTLRALEKVLPRKHWVEINELLVPFGKHICTGTAPRCSTCPVRQWCARVDVTTSR